jgi:energy-coupling factor transporter ATP-binding protein EcfA2
VRSCPPTEPERLPPPAYAWKGRPRHPPQGPQFSSRALPSRSVKYALRGIDLSVPQGTVLGVLGPNGAGKTTAVRILTTLMLPDAGRPRPGRRWRLPRDLRDERVRSRRGDQCLPARAAAIRAPSDRERLQQHRIPDVGHRPAVSALVWQARRLPLVQDCAERAHGFYARTLADDGIKVNALVPGLRRTDLNAPPRPAAATRPRPRGRSGWRYCRTTVPLVSSSPGTRLRSLGDRGTPADGGAPPTQQGTDLPVMRGSNHGNRQCDR